MASGGSAQTPVRGKGNDQCPDHQRSVMFYCVDDGNLCKTDEKYNQGVLSQHEKELNSLLTKLNDKLNKCKDILKSENHVKVIDDDVDEEFNTPCCPEIKYLTFADGRIPSAQMQDGIGTLYRANNSNVVSEFEWPSASSVEKSTVDCLWLFTVGDEHISLVSTEGEIKQKVEVEYKIYCISVSPSTGNLWACCENGMVKELSGSKLSTKFTTDEEYSSLFVHASGNSLIMGTQGKVTLFSTTDQVLKTTQSNDSHLFVVPWHISVCNTTGDIAVCDADTADMVGKDKPHVTVLDSTLCVKYTYYGPSALQCSYIDIDDCYCFDAVYDFQGHLLVSDSGNACIHVVSSEGQFLTLLYIDQQTFGCLTLMDENVLCVAFEDKIKKIQYNIMSAI